MLMHPEIKMNFYANAEIYLEYLPFLIQAVHDL